MTPDSIVDSIANQADDLLADARSVAEARTGIAEILSAEYPTLTGPERQKVIDAVLRILNEEGFFESRRGMAGGGDAEESADEE